MTAPFGHLPISDLTGSNDEGGRAKKRRFINVTDTPQKLDIGKASLNESRRLVAIVDLAWLNPTWGQRMEANRPLSEKHVQTLVDDLTRSIRRFDVENHCKASADPVLIQRLIDTAEHPTSFKALRKKTLLDWKLPTSEPLTCLCHLKDQLVNSLWMPDNIDELLPDTKSTTRTIELYDYDMLASDPMAQVRLRYNGAVARHKGSFGDDFSFLHFIWAKFNAETRSDILSS
ncbi:uncharacterized protein BDV14DRAFT_198545 [Aspergillus stella-maris]|uniref:uncharacterized protein n=1 Tax=Aspergillus stella-maris TaxID=1810926 RepID=UPI003CCD9585